MYPYSVRTSNIGKSTIVALSRLFSIIYRKSLKILIGPMVVLDIFCSSEMRWPGCEVRLVHGQIRLSMTALSDRQCAVPKWSVAYHSLIRKIQDIIESHSGSGPGSPASSNSHGRTSDSNIRVITATLTLSNCFLP